MDTNESAVSRRRFLVLSCGAAAVGACSSGPVPPQQAGKLMVGAASQFTSAAVTAVPAAVPLAIGHDANGFYAMTLTCTHAGCTVGVCDDAAAMMTPPALSAYGCTDSSSNAPPLQCPCHGSQYDAVGNVVRGPAPAALDHFAMSFDANQNITVDTGMIVAPSVRYNPM